MLLDMRLEHAIIRSRPAAAEHHRVAGFARQLLAKPAKRRVRAFILCRIKTHRRIKKWSLWPIARRRRDNVERVLAYDAELKAAWITAAIVSFDQRRRCLLRVVREIPVDWNVDLESAPAITYPRGPFGCCSNHDGAVSSTMSAFPYRGSS